MARKKARAVGPVEEAANPVASAGQEINAIPDDPPPAGLDPDQPTPELLLWAYRHGIFPMGDPRRKRIDWFSPDPRGIIPLETGKDGEGFHVPRNLSREVRKGRFHIQTDSAFERVIRACGQSRGPTNQSWLNDRLISAYVGLFRRGNAHSIEAWLDGELVGGLYGVHIGGAFFGESMFSRPELGGSNASKVCLVQLVSRLRTRGFKLLDTQFWTPHLGQFGCIEIPARTYLQMLGEAVAIDMKWE